MLLSRKDIGIPLDRQNRNNHNDNFKELYDEYVSLGLSTKESLKKASEAIDLSERTQKELTEAILRGDSSPLAGQLSVGSDGKTYDGPQERLIAENEKITTQLSDPVLHRKIHVSETEPTEGDGSPGDLWMVYSEKKPWRDDFFKREIDTEKWEVDEVGGEVFYQERGTLVMNTESDPSKRGFITAKNPIQLRTDGVFRVSYIYDEMDNPKGKGAVEFTNRKVDGLSDWSWGDDLALTFNLRPEDGGKGQISWWNNNDNRFYWAESVGKWAIDPPSSTRMFDFPLSQGDEIICEVIIQSGSLGFSAENTSKGVKIRTTSIGASDFKYSPNSIYPILYDNSDDPDGYGYKMRWDYVEYT